MYQTHLFSEHRNIDKFKCNCLTDIDITEFDYLKRLHIYTDHRGSFHCSNCWNTFNHEEEYQKHIMSHDSAQLSICDYCGYKTSKKNTYSHFTNVHVDNIPQKCDVCSSNFKNRKSMIGHRKSAHELEKETCPHCGGKYRRMKSHIMAIHTDDKNKCYFCDKCERGFTGKQKLEFHIRSVHTGEKPYPCRYLCGLACVDAGNRKKNEVRKHGNQWRTDVNLIDR